MKYKVRFWQDNEYEVIKISYSHRTYTTAGFYVPTAVNEEQVFKGSLSDCEAYIRLHENGYMD